jgi:hypothetical protein
MSRNERIAITVGVTLGLAIAVGAALWQQQTAGPSEKTVQRAVVTTIQKETPESFLITGTLQVTAEATVDSSSTISPRWFTDLVEYADADLGASLTSFASVRDRATVKVPGRVSYGFDVKQLQPSMIAVEGDLVSVDLPPLSVRGIEPELGKLEVRTSQTGTWKRMFVTNPDSIAKEVRAKALEQVQQAFREQAEARIRTATQPRLNTARALQTMLEPTLLAVGLPHPRFRIRIGENLVLGPDEAGEADSLSRK